MGREITYKHSFKLERRAAGLYVQNTGRQQCAPGYRWGPGVRDHYLIHHVISGRGALEVGGRRYELGPGDTFLICPDTSSSYCADGEQPWEYVWVGFGGPEARALLEQTDLSPASPVLRGFYPQEVKRLLVTLYGDYGAAPGSTASITGRLYLFLAFLIRNSSQARHLSAPSGQDCARAAADYVMRHYERPITVEELAAFVSVSQSSLYRSFKKQFHLSPKRFILEYRIQRACLLLQAGGLSVREISNSVGFEDPLYFSRAFKLVKGVSPRAFAAARREEAGD